MSPDQINAAVAVVGLLIVLGGWAVTWGRLNQRIQDIEKARAEDRAAFEADLTSLELRLGREIGELRRRVEVAERTAGEVKGLAQAVEHLGERIGREVKHLAEVMGLKVDNLKVEFEGLQREVRVRRRASAPKSRGQA